MANDDLLFADIERGGHGPDQGEDSNASREEVRYEIVGTTNDQREVAVICRLKETGKLLFITTYALE